MATSNALILSDNVIVAHQIATLLGSLNLNTRTVYNRIDAYAALDASSTTEAERISVLITDIEKPELEGNTIASWYKAATKTKNISWYAICGPHCEEKPMLIARAQRVDGVFYLNRNGLSLDPTTGLAREILNVRPTPRRSWRQSIPRLRKPAAWLDEALFAAT